MAQFEHGSMDTAAHEQTFAGFVRTAFYVGAFAIGVLIFLAVFNS